MITLTKEWLLKTIAELEADRDAVPGVVNEDAARALEAMKIALASLEADVVAWTDEQELRDVEKYGCGYLFTANPVTPNADPHRVIKLYTAPPAPVSLPDEVSWEDVPEEITEDDMALASAWAHGFNQCRAAMLQGVENAETPTTMQTAPTLDSSPKIAESPTGINQGKSEPVTTANKLPFEQWLSQQTGTIDVECGCVMTEVFFHWLRVAYEAGNYPVIPDGWVLVPIEPTYQMCEAMGLQWESPRFPDRYKGMLAAVKK
ncbi:hypothetical protein N3Z97_12485 [Enterobacter hormaechei]|uniref:hypothetical protein n=1 Tax=Enterobacter hormaechei TaxID=158836 RepID=UPI0028E644ED|nr:hypothetical protein [Enterobacter hormaechei]MCW3144567.1 hypothetical protein [Enterobacter hormaechei]